MLCGRVLNLSQRIFQAQINGGKLTGNTVGMIISDVINWRNRRKQELSSHCWRLSASSIDRFLEKGKNGVITFEFSRRRNCCK